jgi:hypothetical protein
MKSLAWSLACFTAVVGGGCARTEPAPRPTPTPAPVVVSGSLQEGYTGRPITTGEVVLGGYAGPKREYTIFATAALDAGGRFRFEPVAHRADMPHSLDLEWTPGHAGRALLREQDARKPDHREAAQDALWAVRVVRLPEGRVFRTTISADPPQAIKLDANGRPADGRGDVEGDPKPALREWLAGLAM